MDEVIIDGIAYEREDTDDNICLRRYDTALKTRIALYFPKQTEAEQKETEAETLRVLTELYIDRLMEGDGDNYAR